MARNCVVEYFIHCINTFLCVRACWVSCYGPEVLCVVDFAKHSLIHTIPLTVYLV